VVVVMAMGRIFDARIFGLDEEVDLLACPPFGIGLGMVEMTRDKGENGVQGPYL